MAGRRIGGLLLGDQAAVPGCLRETQPCEDGCRGAERLDQFLRFPRSECGASSRKRELCHWPPCFSFKRTVHVVKHVKHAHALANPEDPQGFPRKPSVFALHQAPSLMGEMLLGIFGLSFRSNAVANAPHEPNAEAKVRAELAERLALRKTPSDELDNAP